MVKVEYQVLSEAANDLSALTKSLNKLGDSGWEVVTVLPQAGNAHLIYLKKKN